MLAETVFFGSAGLIAYAYFGYPLAISVLRRFAKKRVHKKETLPKVSFIIAGYNEEKVIAAKLRNVLALDYPENRLEVIFGSDGSTDETVKIARSFEAKGMKIMEFKERRGKVSVLNDAVAAATGEILVFSDSRQLFEGAALRSLVAPFSDPDIGAVSGELMLGVAASGFGSSMVTYWNYEKSVRKAESDIDSVIGVTGAIWAIRKGLFEPYPPETILDDLYQPLRVILKGYRVVFEPAAKAFDEASRAPGQEIRRKARTIAGNWQIFLGMKGVLNPFRNRAFFQLVSHKLLRVMVPFLLAAAFMSNLFLAGEPLYRLLLQAQAAFHGLCLLSVLVPFRVSALKVFSAFTILNYSAVVGFFRYITNSQEVIWKK